MIRLVAALLIGGSALSVSAVAGDVHSIAQAVDEHYNHLRSLQAEFTEEYRGAGMERTESGTLWLSKSGLKKTWQDAVGVPFSQGEALCE